MYKTFYFRVFYFDLFVRETPNSFAMQDSRPFVATKVTPCYLGYLIFSVSWSPADSLVGMRKADNEQAYQLPTVRHQLENS